VLSTLHTIDASSSLDRIIGVFPLSDQQSIRNRVAKSFRYIVSQRLIPRKDGPGRVAIVEILKLEFRSCKTTFITNRKWIRKVMEIIKAPASQLSTDAVFNRGGRYSSANFEGQKPNSRKAKLRCSD
jgi:Tfp pilus assembly pilus retraction ATPase PilT